MASKIYCTAVTVLRVCRVTSTDPALPRSTGSSGNLSWGTNNDTLRDAFSQFGQITDCIVMTEPGTGRSRGFGFVTFAEQSSADAAIQAMNDQELLVPTFAGLDLNAATLWIWTRKGFDRPWDPEGWRTTPASSSTSSPPFLVVFGFL
ncbi:hypothetical protein JCM3766R1_002606 [Sporobolomyces carnicolor]